MKALHRTKTLAAYEGARVVLKTKMAYPSYMLLKESARGILSYIVEDQMDKDISDKTKLSRLLALMDTSDVSEEDIENIQKLVDAEQRGLTGILSMDISELRSIKHTIKALIAEYMKEPI